MPEIKRDIRAATLVVAASNSLHPDMADYVCTGVNDHLVIQAALDALPATGGEVKLLDGTYNCVANLTIPANGCLEGCGWNTILNFSGAAITNAISTNGENVKVRNLKAQLAAGAGAPGSRPNVIRSAHNYVELTGLYVVGDKSVADDGSVLRQNGIFLNGSLYSYVLDCYVTNNKRNGIAIESSNDALVRGNYSFANSYHGIYIHNSYQSRVIGNFCRLNTGNGIHSEASGYNAVVGNQSWYNDLSAIYIASTGYNTVVGNHCVDSNDYAIHLDNTKYNTLVGNNCEGCRDHGIYISNSIHNTVIGNNILDMSQVLGNTCDDIHITTNSSYNNIQGNTCRAGIAPKKPRYGIYIATADCIGNTVIANDLYNDGFGTAPFNDSGTGTKLNTYKVPFSDGSDPQDSGFLIDADTEYARGWLRLPGKVVQVVRMKVYARSVAAEADKMRGEFVVYGGADNEPYNTHNGSIANHPSTSSNFAADDVIYWTLTTAGVLALLGGDSVEVKVLHEAAGNGDCATNAYLRTVEVEYV